MADVRLGSAWLAELRDLFLGSGRFIVSEGTLWRLDESSMLWRGYSWDQASKLVIPFLDANDYHRPGSRGWVQIQNSLSTRNELRALVWSEPSIDRPGFFNDAPAGLAVGREWVCVSAKGLARETLTAEHRARSAIAYNLPENAAPPARWLESLSRMFGHNSDGAKKIAAFQEFLGACRVGIVTDYERMVIMPGGGNNGKSTIIMGGAHAIFSPDELRSIAPNYLNQEYHLMMLRGAALNFLTELPKEQINCTERLKQAISGEDMTGRPIREMPVTFRPSAGHIFACNNFPKLSDTSKGMRRRLLVLRCDATFGKNDGVRADFVKAFKEEAPQILLWALEGAIRLMSQGDYTFPESHFTEEAEWREADDKAMQFVSDCTQGLDSGWTRASKVYSEYDQWFRKKGFAWNERMDARAFGAALRHIQGFQTKDKNYGKDYNFVVKPHHEWKDIYWGDEPEEKS